MKGFSFVLIRPPMACLAPGVSSLSAANRPLYHLLAQRDHGCGVLLQRSRFAMPQEFGHLLRRQRVIDAIRSSSKSILPRLTFLFPLQQI